MLPFRIRDEIYRASELHSGFEDKISEIRLRRTGRSSLTVSGENIPLGVTLTKEEMDETVKRFCDGSVYAHSDTINEGYISLADGVRVGIVGRAVCEGGTVCGVVDVSSLNVRIPHFIFGLGVPVLSLISSEEGLGGVLIYSLPGVGKTTLLRSLAYEIAKKKRVAIVDTRHELSSMNARSNYADVLLGYPKDIGIEIATRTLSPEYIVCDEIGGGECNAILRARTGGIPIIASVHASGFDEIKSSSSVLPLIRSGIFDIFVGITRPKGASDYIYKINTKKELSDD